MTRSLPVAVPTGMLRAAGILVGSRMDRMLIAEALDDLGFVSHDLSGVEPGRGAWGAVDILVMDERSAATLGEGVARAKDRVSPAFLPVLVVVPRMGSAERHLRAGFDDVLRLPIPAEELKGRLRMHLRLRERTLEAERAVFDRLPLGLFRANGAGEVVTANPAMARLLGFETPSALQAAGPLLEGLNLPDLQPRLALALEGDGELNGVELPWLRPDGSLVWLRWTGRVHSDESGRVILAEGAAEDVTLQRRTQMELDASRELNLATIDSLGANLAILDSAGVIISVNRAWRIFGQSGDLPPDWPGSVGLNYLDVCDGVLGEDSRTAGRAAEGIRQVLSGASELFELEYRMDVPEVRWFAMRVTPLRGTEDRLGAVVTHVDVTAQHRAEETLRIREHELRQAQKMEAVGRLAGGIAHDFNNLLTAIRGNTALLRDELPEGAPARGDIEEIDEAVTRAGTLTRQLLVLSRRQVQRVQDVELTGLVRGTLPLLRQLLREDVTLGFDPPAHPLVVRGDPGNLEMILLNLALNARDAMPGGGHLRVILHRGEGGPDGDERATAVIDVEDTGEGMTETVRERAFEPFFTTREAGRGSGLGLSIVHGIVDQMDGHIVIQSTRGVGTLVRIVLPLGEDPERFASAGPPLERAAPADQADPAEGRWNGTRGSREADEAPPVARPGETLLLVEDDPQVRRPTERILERLGYRVLSAGDGAEGLEILLGDDPVDLVVTDVVMPQLTGPDMIRKLRELRAREPQSVQEPRILFISGYTAGEVDFFTDRAGVPVPRLLQKPFDLLTLASTIRAVLDEDAPSGHD